MWLKAKKRHEKMSHNKCREECKVEWSARRIQKKIECREKRNAKSKCAKDAFWIRIAQNTITLWELLSIVTSSLFDAVRGIEANVMREKNCVGVIILQEHVKFNCQMLCFPNVLNSFCHNATKKSHALQRTYSTAGNEYGKLSEWCQHKKQYLSDIEIPAQSGTIERQG